MLFHLRDAFRAGDLWLARSRRYGDIRKTLLSAPAVVDADRSLPVPASPQDWLAERKGALDEGLRRLDAAARAGAIAGASIDEGMLRIERRSVTPSWRMSGCRLRPRVNPSEGVSSTA